jgi:hypothetical protein
LLDLWGFAQAGGRNKQRSAVDRHRNPFPNARVGASRLTLEPFWSESWEFEIGPGALRWRLDRL